MQNNFKFHSLGFLLLAALALPACSDDDDEPVASHVKKGFFKGTVNGLKQDGTAFSEPFTYAYATNSLEYFSNYGTIQPGSFIRTLNPGWDNSSMRTDITAFPDGTVNLDAAIFSFSKKIDKGTLFIIEAEADFSPPSAYIRQIMAEQNTNYNFLTNIYGVIYYDRYLYQDGTLDTYRFYTDYYEVYYSAATGALVAVYDRINEIALTSGAMFTLYNSLVFKLNTSVGQRVFYDAATNTSLHQQMPGGPADTFTISNYVLNASTGVVTFDFQVNINGVSSHGSRRKNTTQHDLIITGKFNSGEDVIQKVVYSAK